MAVCLKCENCVLNGTLTRIPYSANLCYMKALTANDVLNLLRRKQGDRTAVELAKEIGVSPAYLSDIYNGRRDPGPRVLEFLGIEKAFVQSEQTA